MCSDQYMDGSECHLCRLNTLMVLKTRKVLNKNHLPFDSETIYLLSMQEKHNCFLQQNAND